MTRKETNVGFLRLKREWWEEHLKHIWNLQQTAFERFISKELNIPSTTALFVHFCNFCDSSLYLVVVGSWNAHQQFELLLNTLYSSSFPESLSYHDIEQESLPSLAAHPFQTQMSMGLPWFIQMANLFPILKLPIKPGYYNLISKTFLQSQSRTHSPSE